MRPFPFSFPPLSFLSILGPSLLSSYGVCELSKSNNVLTPFTWVWIIVSFCPEAVTQLHTSVKPRVDEGSGLRLCRRLMTLPVLLHHHITSSQGLTDWNHVWMVPVDHVWRGQRDLATIKHGRSAVRWKTSLHFALWLRRSERGSSRIKMKFQSWRSITTNHY